MVALAAGFTDGLGMGSNTKAAIVRLGLKEMEAFIRHFYPATSSHVFSESCGVADLITTCFAGRNRKCAEAFAASRVQGKSREWKDIESELLNGQKLQGVLTAQEIYPLIELHRLQPLLPLRQMVEGEPIDGYVVEATGQRVDALKRSTVGRLPHTLILQLKR